MTHSVACALAALLLTPAPPSDAPEPSTAPPAAGAVDAANAFALEFLLAAGGARDDLICSPASTYLALLLAYTGANGETAEELARVLHLSDARPGQPRDRRAALAAARTLLRRADGVDGTPRLSIVNSLWKQSGHPLLDEYLMRAEGELGTSLFDVDFQGDPESAREAINAWVGAATDGRISGLLNESDVNGLTRLVLANAVSFQAAWADHFEVLDTRPAPFLRSDGRRVSVPTMHRLDDERILEDEDFQLLELGYQRSFGDDPGARWSMLVLLPRPGRDLAELERELSPERLADWCAALEERRVDISLPRFQISCRLELSAALRRMGLRTLFDPLRCDLTGIDGGAGPLALDRIVHAAEVTVDEYGTEASAATVAVTLSDDEIDPPAPLTFRADHPFLFLVRDRTSGQILFAGRVANPG